MSGLRKAVIAAGSGWAVSLGLAEVGSALSGANIGEMFGLASMWVLVLGAAAALIFVYSEDGA